jgi:hypothetical protein
VTELSSYISTRYQRPPSSIMIAITHSSCLLFGGTFDPGYILTLSAVETYMQSATNKRNTALLQSFLSDLLSVPPDRGVVRFIPVREDCLGTGGRTIASEVERVAVNTGVRRNLKTSVRKSVASALKRRPPNIGIRSPASPTGSGPKSPYLAEKRRSLLSMGRSSKEEDRLQRKDSKIKEKRVSLHPPGPEDLPLSSRSSLSIPSPVYMDHKQKGDATENLLDEATKVLTMHASDTGHSSKSLPQNQTDNHPPPKEYKQPDENAGSVPETNSEPTKSKAEPQLFATLEAGHADRTNAATQPVKAPHQLVPPPTPKSQPAPKMGRRKSLLAIFKRDQSAKAVT